MLSGGGINRLLTHDYFTFQDVNMDNGYFQMQEYHVPVWAKQLNNIPSHIVKVSTRIVYIL